MREGLEHNRLSLLLNVGEGEALMELVRRGHTELVDDAVAAFERGANLFPNAREPQRIAGLRLLELRMPTRALVWFERALVLGPTGDPAAESLLLSAVAYRSLGQTDDAMTAANDSLTHVKSDSIEAQIRTLMASLVPGPSQP